jgi:hypothetical protein
MLKIDTPIMLGVVDSYVCTYSPKIAIKLHGWSRFLLAKGDHEAPEK